jgi:hypothetical protein
MDFAVVLGSTKLITAPSQLLFGFRNAIVRTKLVEAEAGQNRRTPERRTVAPHSKTICQQLASDCSGPNCRWCVWRDEGGKRRSVC